MMSHLGTKSSIDQYQEYVASTLRLNSALNAELSTCYTRISQLEKQLTQSELLHVDRAREISDLKNSLQQFEQKTNRSRNKTNNSERVSISQNIFFETNGFQIDSLATSRSNPSLKETIKTQGKSNYTQLKGAKSGHAVEKVESVRDFHLEEMERLLSDNRYLQNQLGIRQIELSQLGLSLSNSELEINKLEQILNQRLLMIEDMQEQRDKMLEQLTKKQQIINEFQFKLRVQESELEESNKQIYRIQQMEHEIVELSRKNQEFQKVDKLKQSNITLQHRVKQLQEFVSILEAQNIAIKSNNRQNERKQNHSKELKKQSVLETQLKIMKQQCANVVAQNISLIQNNSRLEKLKMEIMKQLEFMRKERLEFQQEYSHLRSENQNLSKQLSRKSFQIQQMNTRIRARESEAIQLKSITSKQIISHLDKNLNNSKSFKGVLGRLITKNSNPLNKEEVPVRDASRSCKIIKSRSTLAIYK